MPDILTLLLISFASYILLYGGCCSIDITDIEKEEILELINTLRK